jgi:hypothetical protein
VETGPGSGDEGTAGQAMGEKRRLATRSGRLDVKRINMKTTSWMHVVVATEPGRDVLRNQATALCGRPARSSSSPAVRHHHRHIIIVSGFTSLASIAIS